MAGREDGAGQYVEAWLAFHSASVSAGKGAFPQEPNPAGVQALCEHLYQNLTILDAKSAGIIASNAITTALLPAFAFAAHSPEAGSSVQIACLVLMLVSGASLILNVSVLNVYWSTTAELKGDVDLRSRAHRLLAIRDKRTWRYRMSHRLHISVLAVGLFGIAAKVLNEAGLVATTFHCIAIGRLGVCWIC